MKNFRNIFIAFIIGAFCRYIFFISYGYFYFIAEHYGFKANLSSSLSKLFGAASLQLQSVFETLIVIPISIFIPAIIFGFYINESKRRYLLYSLSSLAGLICFDLFYYSLVINDLDLLLNNYLPVWYGIIMIFIWIVLFYSIYSLGRQFGGTRR